MDNLDSLQILKKMIDGPGDDLTESQRQQVRLFKAVNDAMFKADKTASSMMVYEPNKMIAFLDKPIAELRVLLGGEWIEMSEGDFEELVYLVQKKVKKSTQLIDWDKK